MVPGRLARGHSRRCRLPRFPLSPSTFLRPFAPDPLQTLLSSYGRSDSCPPRSWTLSLIACSTYGQGSLIHAPGLPTILSPTTCGRSVSPRYATFRRIESRSLPYGSSPYGNSRLRHSLATSPHLAGRIEFLSYGLAVHLRLLSTPSRDDAVTFGYRVTLTRRGLPPLRPSALSGARVRHLAAAFLAASLLAGFRMQIQCPSRRWD